MIEKKHMVYAVFFLLILISLGTSFSAVSITSLGNGSGSAPSTEAELEANLTDVSDVYTDNDFTANPANWDNAYTWSNFLYNTIGLSALTSAEVDQLENIGGTTISAAQWGYVGDMDQSVASDQNVAFESVNISATSDISYNDGTDTMDIRSDGKINLTTGGDLVSFEIEDTGIWSSNKQSGCRVRLEVFQPIPAAMWTKLILVIEDYDRHNDYNTVITQFIVPKTGYYICEYSALLINAIGTGVWGSCIYVNALPAGAFEYSHKISDVEDKIANSGTDILYLTKNDFVELWVYQSGFMFAPNCPAVVYSNYMAITKIA